MSQNKKKSGSLRPNATPGTAVFYPPRTPAGLSGETHIKRIVWSCLPLIMLLLLVLGGCASMDEMGKMRYDLNQLKSKVRELETGGQGGGASLKELEEKQKAAADSVSDLLIQIQSLRADVQMMTGRADEALYASERNSKEMASFITRLDELEKAVNDLKSGSPEIGAVKALPETEEKPPEDKVKEDYMEAFNTFKDDKFAEAREKFLAILKNYSENEYSDNARFWIAETYYKEGNYEDAILAYEDLMKANPDSDKIPGAMLKQGMAFFEINDEETGRIVFEKLVKKYPDSDPARRAKKKLNPIPPKKQ